MAENKVFLKRFPEAAPMPKKRKRLICDEDDGDEAEIFSEAMRKKSWKKLCTDQVAKSAGTIEDQLPVGVVCGPDGLAEIKAKWRPDEAIVPVLPEAPVFFPDADEFADPVKYIASIRSEAEPYGICRIVPPRSWRPPCGLRDEAADGTAKFATRVQQLHRLQKRKRRDFAFGPGPSMTLPEFKNYADRFKANYFTAEDGLRASTLEDFEGEYWRIVESPTEQVEVLYGADLDAAQLGSGFPKAKGSVKDVYEQSGWNLHNCAKSPGSMLYFEDSEISGVTVPWVYVGMCLSSFCWHVEDHFLYSVNYMHFGDPKVWYGVPRSAAALLENTMAKHLSGLFKDQADLLQKLVTQFSPTVLKSESVPVFRAVQRPGDFVVTFPRAYHCGFSTGFSCAEAVNFCSIDWLGHGQAAVELYQKFRRKTALSHDKLLFAAVKACIDAAETTGAKSSFWRETLEDKSQLSLLLKACKARIQTEHSRRSWRNEIKSGKMDNDFDRKERECFHCHFDLYLSAVYCECSPRKRACLEHIDLLCKCLKDKKHALYRYELSELYGFQTALEKLLGDVTVKGEEIAEASRGLGRSSPFKPGAEVIKCSDLRSSSGRELMAEATPGKEPAVVVLSDDDDEVEAEEVADEKKVVDESARSVTTHLRKELLDLGTLSAAGWCTKDSIFLAGFKSRVLYYNFLNLSEKSYYICEIVDCGVEIPYFKVTLDNSAHSFVDVSPDLCWRAIQRRLNFEIHLKRKLGNFNVPKEIPVDEVNGIEMFGLMDPVIKRLVECSDKNKVCKAYWETMEKSPVKQHPEQQLLSSRELLKNLFVKGDKKELWTLHKVLGAEWGKESWKQCFEVLAEVLEKS